MSSGQVDLLIENIVDIIEKLDSLNRMLPEIVEEFQGDEFESQNQLALLLDDKIQALTHEQASSMGFELESLRNLIKFIEFRKKYSFLSDLELEKVIDIDDLTVEFKMSLSKKISNNKQSVFNTIAAIRKDWNEVFSNDEYKKVKSKIGLIK